MTDPDMCDPATSDPAMSDPAMTDPDMTDPAAELRIRPMTPADIDRVLQLALSLPQVPHWPPTAYTSALQPGAIPRRIALVAEDRNTGAVAGFAVAGLLPPQAELESIAVAGGCRRRGLGRRLFTALAPELRSAQAEEVVLEVRASNHAALAFYRSLGFLQTGTRSRYYVDPVEDAVLMTLPLK